MEESHSSCDSVIISSDSQWDKSIFSLLLTEKIENEDLPNKLNIYYNKFKEIYDRYHIDDIVADGYCIKVFEKYLQDIVTFVKQDWSPYNQAIVRVWLEVFCDYTDRNKAGPFPQICFKQLGKTFLDFILCNERNSLKQWYKKCLLRVFNYMVSFAPKRHVKRFINQHQDVLIRMIDCLNSSVEYDTQILLVECVQRLSPKKYLASLHNNLFPGSQAVENMFYRIDTDHFEHDVRKFLNLLNASNNNEFILSINSPCVILGGIQIHTDLCSEKTDSDFWIDFNWKAENLSFSTEFQILSSGRLPKNIAQQYETVTIHFMNVESIQNVPGKDKDDNTVGKLFIFQLNGRCDFISSTSKIADKAKTLQFMVKNDNLANQLGTKLSEVFDERYYQTEEVSNDDNVPIKDSVVHTKIVFSQTSQNQHESEISGPTSSFVEKIKTFAHIKKPSFSKLYWEPSSNMHPLSERESSASQSQKRRKNSSYLIHALPTQTSSPEEITRIPEYPQNLRTSDNEILNSSISASSISDDQTTFHGENNKLKTKPRNFTKSSVIIKLDSISNQQSTNIKNTRKNLKSPKKIKDENGSISSKKSIKSLDTGFASSSNVSLNIENKQKRSPQIQYEESDEDIFSSDGELQSQRKQRSRKKDRRSPTFTPTSRLRSDFNSNVLARPKRSIKKPARFIDEVLNDESPNRSRRKSTTISPNDNNKSQIISKRSQENWTTSEEETDSEVPESLILSSSYINLKTKNVNEEVENKSQELTQSVPREYLPIKSQATNDSRQTVDRIPKTYTEPLKDENCSSTSQNSFKYRRAKFDRAIVPIIHTENLKYTDSPTENTSESYLKTIKESRKTKVFPIIFTEPLKDPDSKSDMFKNNTDIENESTYRLSQKIEKGHRSRSKSRSSINLCDGKKSETVMPTNDCTYIENEPTQPSQKIERERRSRSKSRINLREEKKSVAVIPTNDCTDMEIELAYRVSQKIDKERRSRSKSRSRMNLRDEKKPKTTMPANDYTDIEIELAYRVSQNIERERRSRSKTRSGMNLRDEEKSETVKPKNDCTDMEIEPSYRVSQKIETERRSRSKTRSRMNLQDEEKSETPKNDCTDMEIEPTYRVSQKKGRERRSRSKSMSRINLGDEKKLEIVMPSNDYTDRENEHTLLSQKKEREQRCSSKSRSRMSDQEKLETLIPPKECTDIENEHSSCLRSKPTTNTSVETEFKNQKSQNMMDVSHLKQRLEKAIADSTTSEHTFDNANCRILQNSPKSSEQSINNSEIIEDSQPNEGLEKTVSKMFSTDFSMRALLENTQPSEEAFKPDRRSCNNSLENVKTTKNKRSTRSNSRTTHNKLESEKSNHNRSSSIDIEISEMDLRKDSLLKTKKLFNNKQLRSRSVSIDTVNCDAVSKKSVFEDCDCEPKRKSRTHRIESSESDVPRKHKRDSSLSTDNENYNFKPRKTRSNSIAKDDPDFKPKTKPRTNRIESSESDVPRKHKRDTSMSTDNENYDFKPRKTRSNSITKDDPDFELKTKPRTHRIESSESDVPRKHKRESSLSTDNENYEFKPRKTRSNSIAKYDSDFEPKTKPRTNRIESSESDVPRKHKREPSLSTDNENYDFKPRKTRSNSIAKDDDSDFELNKSRATSTPKIGKFKAYQRPVRQRSASVNRNEPRRETRASSTTNDILDIGTKEKIDPQRDSGSIANIELIEKSKIASKSDISDGSCKPTEQFVSINIENYAQEKSESKFQQIAISNNNENTDFDQNRKSELSCEVKLDKIDQETRKTLTRQRSISSTTDNTGLKPTEARALSSPIDKNIDYSASQKKQQRSVSTETNNSELDLKRKSRDSSDNEEPKIPLKKSQPTKTQIDTNLITKVDPKPNDKPKIQSKTIVKPGKKRGRKPKIVTEKESLKILSNPPHLKRRRSASIDLNDSRISNSSTKRGKRKLYNPNDPSNFDFFDDYDKIRVDTKSLNNSNIEENNEINAKNDLVNVELDVTGPNNDISDAVHIIEDPEPLLNISNIQHLPNEEDDLNGNVNIKTDNISETDGNENLIKKTKPTVLKSKVTKIKGSKKRETKKKQVNEELLDKNLQSEDKENQEPVSVLKISDNIQPHKKKVYDDFNGNVVTNIETTDNSSERDGNENVIKKSKPIVKKSKSTVKKSKISEINYDTEKKQDLFDKILQSPEKETPIKSQTTRRKQTHQKLKSLMSQIFPDNSESETQKTDDLSPPFDFEDEVLNENTKKNTKKNKTKLTKKEIQNSKIQTKKESNEWDNYAKKLNIKPRKKLDLNISEEEFENFSQNIQKSLQDLNDVQMRSEELSDDDSQDNIPLHLLVESKKDDNTMSVRNKSLNISSFNVPQHASIKTNEAIFAGLSMDNKNGNVVSAANATDLLFNLMTWSTSMNETSLKIIEGLESRYKNLKVTEAGRQLATKLRTTAEKLEAKINKT